jgi:putative copper resistance protein D
VIDPLIVARAVHIAATAITAGAILFGVAIVRPVLGRQTAAVEHYLTNLARMTWCTLVIAIVSGLLWAMFLAAQIDDASVGDIFKTTTFTELLTETRFGQVWILRALLAAIVILTLRSAHGVVSLTAAAAMLAAIAWASHSGARSDAVGWFQVTVDMAHLLAAGAWLGSLPALALLLGSQVPASTCAAATRRFSTIGVVAVVILLLTGAANTYLLTDSIAALTETRYGQLLLLKIALFAAMLVLAAINRWHWTPKLPASRAIGAIRRHSLIEAGLGLCAVAIVGVLGTLPPPIHRHVHASEASPEAAFVHIHDIKGMAEITILPGRAGPSEAWIRLMQEDFTPMAAQSVSVRLSQFGQTPVTAEARSGAPGLWRAPDVVLPTPGVWTAVVEVRTGSGSSLVLDGPIVIAP